MTPEYRAALLASRERMGALDRDIAREILREVYAWADRLAVWLASRPDDPRATQVSASRAVIWRTAVELDGRLRKAMLLRRDLAFSDILELWRKAGAEIAQRKDIPNALTGAVERPPLDLLAAVANRPGARTWQTLLRGHVVNAAGEADTIVRRAIIDGVSPPELAQRLRRYVQGSEDFQSAFRKVETKSGEVWKLDLRQIPVSERGAANQMRYNATRIAVTETHAARSEAERLHFLNDPLIAAVKWTLAPDRGTSAGVPDVCTVLAAANQYGLGAGVFPMDKMPPIPAHPFCRCTYTPIERPVSQANDPKPTAVRQLGIDEVTIPRSDQLTALGARRIREQVANLVGFV